MGTEFSVSLIVSGSFYFQSLIFTHNPVDYLIAKLIKGKITAWFYYFLTVLYHFYPINRTINPTFLVIWYLLIMVLIPVFIDLGIDGDTIKL